MTSVMRSNFKQYSQYVTLGTMKKESNTNLMPYISVVVLDGMNMVQVRCEALMISKTSEVYEIMLEACFKMAPATKRETYNAHLATNS